VIVQRWHVKSDPCEREMRSRAMPFDRLRFQTNVEPSRLSRDLLFDLLSKIRSALGASSRCTTRKKHQRERERERDAVSSRFVPFVRTFYV